MPRLPEIVYLYSLFWMLKFGSVREPGAGVVDMVDVPHPHPDPRQRCKAACRPQVRMHHVRVKGRHGRAQPSHAAQDSAQVASGA